MADNIDNSGDFNRAEAESQKLIQQLKRANQRAEEFAAAEKTDASLRRRLTDQLRRDVAADRIKGETLSESQVRKVDQVKKDKQAVESTQRRITQEEKRTAAAEASRGQRLKENVRLQDSYGRGQQRIADQARRSRFVADSSGQVGRPGDFRRQLPPGQTPPRYPALPPGRPGGIPLLPATTTGGPDPYKTATGRGAQPVFSAPPARSFSVSGAGEVKEQINAQEALGKAQLRAANAARIQGKAGEQLTLGQKSQNQIFSEGINSLSRYSTAMRRHGALTTEFISAAARGSVTIRELGFQTGATIGKFAGWLGAGAAIFTALGAVRQMGTGAIDSASGVNQLARVLTDDLDTTAATRGFRELSQEFNLPIDQVTQAQYGMAKVFQDQEESLKGAQAALFAVKVGELDVVTATRYLTAIVNGFGLSGTEMAVVMDQLNEAQNRFGVSIPDTAAGVAKAAGTFKAAGGDLNSLLAIITTAQKVTGQTGEVVGTALARAPAQIRREGHAQVLRQFGVDASAGIDQIITQAFKSAQRLSGEELQLLSGALFGNLYGARIGTPLLQNYEKYKEALDLTSPAKAAGSAQKELNTLLGSYEERLAAVLNKLQVFGSGLADAGALDLFGAGLETITRMVDAANALLEAFNKLPGPLKSALSVGAQLYGVLRLTRRLQVGTLFKQGSASQKFFTPPDNDLRLYREGIQNQRAYLATSLESASAARAEAGTRVLVANESLAAEQARLQKVLVTQGALSEDAVTAEKRVVAAQVAENAAQEAALNAKVQEGTLLRTSIAIEEKNAVLQRAKTNVQAQRVASQFGDTIPTGFGGDGLPNSDDLERLAREQGHELGEDFHSSRQAYSQSIISSLDDETGSALNRAAASPVGLNQASQAAAGQASRMRLYADRLSRTGISGRVLATTGRALGRVPRVLSRIGTGLKGLGIRMAGFARGLGSFVGPLDIFLAVAYGTYKAISGTISEQNQQAELLDKVVSVQASSRKELDKAREQASQLAARATEGSPLGDARRFGADILSGLTSLSPIQIQSGQEETIEKLEAAELAERAVAERQIQYNNALRSLADFKAPEGAALNFVFPEDIKESLDKAITRFQAGADGVRQFNKNTNELLKAVRLATDLEAKEKRKLASEITVAKIDTRGVGGGYAELATLTTEDLGKSIDLYAKLVESGDATQKDVTSFVRQAVYQVATGITGSATDRAAAFAAADTIGDTINAAAESERDRATLFARSRSERNAAYDEYLNAVDPKKGTQAVERQRKDARDRLSRNIEAQKQLREDSRSLSDRGLRAGRGADGELLLGGTKGRTSDRLKELIAERKQLEKSLKQREGEQKDIRKELKGLDEAEKLIRERLRQIKKEAKIADLERRQEEVGARGEFRASQTNDELKKLQIRITTINRQIVLATKAHGRDSQEVLALLSERNGLRSEIFDYGTSLIQAKGDYALSGIDSNDGVGQAQQSLSTARQLLARARQKGDELGIIEAATEVRNAEQALNQSIEERADAIQAAQFELERARAFGQEVRLAKIDVREARSKLGNADTLAEQLSARAGLIEAKRNLEQTRAQKEIEDVQFSADIGKLSLEAQIREYRKILRTMDLTRDLRRDLRRRIHQLKEEIEGESDNYELAVGDIKLPTIYEIRRAIQGGLNQPPNVTLSQANTYQINGAQDPQATADAVAARSNDAAKKNRNMMRSAGLV